MAASGNPLAPNPETNIDNPGFPNAPIAPEEPQEDLGNGVPVGETGQDSGTDESRRKMSYAYYGPM